MVTRTYTDTGQLFVVGYQGEQVPQSFVDLVGRRQLGGVILFEDNCRSYTAARESIAAIRKQYTRTAPMIAVDQEGGRVCRLRGVPAEFRAPADYARDNALEQYAEDFSRAMVYMESLGINCNLAPVCDLFLDEGNTCLDGRCFGDSPEVVGPFIEKSIKLARTHGLLSCAKHFPGLGAATIDPHEATAEADYDLNTWSTREMRPFEIAVRAQVDMIMTTHLRLPAIDDTIATGSSKITDHMIRTMLGYEGPVITDDLLMSGAAELGDVGERAIAAFLAGHDLLLFGQDTEAAIEAMEA
ncbi:hypothetical protein GF420_15125, partial [candidate division GN15 bacterium]|nr:hypothetical protein [candidate division GN15 bacterium]